MKVLKGAPAAAAIRTQILETLQGSEKAPCLAIVRIGAREEDLSYERGAVKRMTGLGIRTEVFEYPQDISHEAFAEAFAGINASPEIDGILLFRPLPSQIDEAAIVAMMDPRKDMDGISRENLAGVFRGDKEAYAPCTAEAVVRLMQHYELPLEGANIVVLGRSLVVGKPLSMLLLQENATVTICHSRTKELKQICRQADVVISAIGKARWVDSSYLKEGAAVIDVGINVDENGQLCGDVNFAEIEATASMATPVPGGIGAVTTTILAEHVVRAFKQKKV